MNSPPLLVKTLSALIAALFSAAVLGALVLGGVYIYFDPQMPAPGEIGEAALNEPLRIYTADGRLIGEFGAQRRMPVAYKNIPRRVVRAFLAAEDDRFFEHPGVDYQGLLRASWHLLRTGEKTQGGSTITMQLTRNLFLSRERTYARKIKEIFLSLRLESALSKPEILELYLNKIFLGNHAYGVGAAADVYFDKTLDELSLAEAATIAGLPKAPSYYNPTAHPERARGRRDYVLQRMRALGFIDEQAFERAKEQPVTTATRVADKRQEADYVAEMVRQAMVARYGEQAAYSMGLAVTTTIIDSRQRAANQALRRDLLAYDRRHDWRGAESTVAAEILSDREAMNTALTERPEAGSLVPAIVLKVNQDSATLYSEPAGEVTIGRAAAAWLAEDQPLSALLSPGDQVRLGHADKNQPGLKAEDGREPDQKEKESAWSLAQIPKVQGALVAINPRDGAIEALAGGFDFNLSKFNRALQARRQPGSAFKPFLYSAALAHGFTAASIVNDAPVVFEAPGLDNDWRPQNYSGRIHGPTRVREGLVHSRNLVSIRLLRSIGINTAINYVGRFGLPTESMPRDLSLSLGSASFSPLQMARAYAVFANGGFLVAPYFIREIRDSTGAVLEAAQPPHACVEDCDGLEAPRAPRAIDPTNAYIMTSMLRDVIQRGTGRRANKLGRKDLAGKTGTTNDQKDAWFTGFNRDLVAVSWVGYDKLEPLGDKETGASAALPMWIDFMGSALAGKEEATMARPGGLVTVRIDPDTGNLAGANGGIFETFRSGSAPTQRAETGGDVERLF